MSKQYCTTCGTNMELIERRRLKHKSSTLYNHQTGEPLKAWVCPNKKCENHCDAWGHNYKRITWWNSDVKCVNCGDTPDDQINLKW